MSPCSVYTSPKKRPEVYRSRPQRFHGWRKFLQCWVAPWPWMTSRSTDRYANGSWRASCSWGCLSFHIFGFKWWINCSHNACIIKWSKLFWHSLFGEWHQRHDVTIIYHYLINFKHHTITIKHQSNYCILLSSDHLASTCFGNLPRSTSSFSDTTQ